MGWMGSCPLHHIESLSFLQIPCHNLFADKLLRQSLKEENGLGRAVLQWNEYIEFILEFCQILIWVYLWDKVVDLNLEDSCIIYSGVNDAISVYTWPTGNY